jgi:hypothetical protein
MADPRILIVDVPQQRELRADTLAAWRWVGWFSLLLSLAGLGDWVLTWTPLQFGAMEWEFGTVVASFSGLPLITMGVAGMLASALARGTRTQVTVLSIVVIVFGVSIIAALLVFLLNVPLALNAVQGPAHRGIVKAIAKTCLLGVLFSAGYLVAGFATLRHAFKRSSR